MDNNNYIYGKNAVAEALEAGKPIEKILVCFGNQAVGGMSRIYKLAKDAGVACVSYDKRKFMALEKELCGKGSEGNDTNALKTQGVIAMVRTFDILEVDAVISILGEEVNPVIVVLDEIADPHNLGAIARSAECAGAGGLIITERNSAPLSPAAVKASAGALEHIPVAKVGNLATTLEKLKAAGYWIVGTDGAGDRDYTDDIYDRPIALVIGSEGKGMRPLIEKHCDYLVRIPMRGKINSLNASVSAGVVLFEMLRQKMARSKA